MKECQLTNYVLWKKDVYLLVMAQVVEITKGRLSSRHSTSRELLHNNLSQFLQCRKDFENIFGYWLERASCKDLQYFYDKYYLVDKIVVLYASLLVTPFYFFMKFE